MQQIKKNKITIILIILIILFLLFFLIPQKTKEEVSPPINIKINNLENNLPPNKLTIKILEINGIKYETETKDPISIADFMEKLKTERKIDFKETNYTGMGKFIEEINNIKNSGDKNWIYYVNNKKANIGISNYQINSGDVVSWKYENNY